MDVHEKKVDVCIVHGPFDKTPKYEVTTIGMESTGIYWKPIFNVMDLITNDNHFDKIRDSGLIEVWSNTKAIKRLLDGIDDYKDVTISSPLCTNEQFPPLPAHARAPAPVSERPSGLPAPTASRAKGCQAGRASTCWPTQGKVELAVAPNPKDVDSKENQLVILLFAIGFMVFMRHDLGFVLMFSGLSTLMAFGLFYQRTYGR